MMNRIVASLRDRVQRSPVDSERDAPELLWAIEAARQFVHARTPPDLRGPVLQQIQCADVTCGRPAARWWARYRSLCQPRAVVLRLRPIYGIAAVIVVVGLMALGSLAPDAEQPTARATAAFVEFRLHAAEASSVRLAGTFTNWQLTTALHEVSPGVWTATVLLPFGVHDYAYVVDGHRWVADPYTPAIPDGFGGQANRLALLPQLERSSL